MAIVVYPTSNCISITLTNEPGNSKGTVYKTGQVDKVSLDVSRMLKTTAYKGAILRVEGFENPARVRKLVFNKLTSK